MAAGNHVIEVIYNGDSYTAVNSKSAEFTVKTSSISVEPKVVMKQSSVLYTGQYSVTVYGNDGKAAKGVYVSFYIGGKYYMKVKTDSKGVATITIPSKYLPNKVYVVKAVALGKTASKKVGVKQIATIKTVLVKKSGKLVLTATLKKDNGKYLNGKAITFYFNGKKVKTVKTNKYGVANVVVKKSWYGGLKVGKKVIYEARYAKTSVKKIAIVKK